MLVEDVVKLIRSFLHDPITLNEGKVEYDRYSPEIIRMYLNLGMADFVSSTNLNKRSEYLQYPTLDNPYVDLPDGIITSIKLNGCPLSKQSESEACNLERSASLTTDTPELLFSADGKQLSLTSVGSEFANIIIEPLDLDYSLFNFSYGTMPDFSEYKNLDTYNVDSPYGATRFTTKAELFQYDLQVEYNANVEVSSDDVDFPLDDKYALCIKHYVCGHLLRDDKDSHSHELGLEELTLYNNCVTKAKAFADNGGSIQLEHTNISSYEMPYVRSI